MPGSKRSWVLISWCICGRFIGAKVHVGCTKQPSGCQQILQRCVAKWYGGVVQHAEVASRPYRCCCRWCLLVHVHGGQHGVFVARMGGRHTRAEFLQAVLTMLGWCTLAHCQSHKLVRRDGSYYIHTLAWCMLHQSFIHRCAPCLRGWGFLAVLTAPFWCLLL